MRKRIFTSKIATLALFTFVGLVAALAIAWPNLARAHSPGEAALTALTVTAGGTAQTLTPTFDSAVYFYTVHVDNSVAQITIEGTPDGDGSVAYQDMDGTALPDADATTSGQQVAIPTAGKRINVVVSHTDSMATTTQTYTVLVIREGTVATDRAALMALYNSTNGEGWTTNTNWGSAEPLSAWYQVSVNADGRVTTLGPTIPICGGNNLVGTLPAALGNLDQMEKLSLCDNQLSGSIPDLGRLSELQLLRMWNNQLSGEIPASLSALTNLTSLDISRNNFDGPIPDLSRNPNLQFLDLHGNQLSGTIPASLGNLTSLTGLELDNNRLTGEIPASLGNLTGLRNLFLHGNQLSGTIPEELGNLTSLHRLNLYNNQLSGTIPASLGNLTTLRHLYLKENQLTGEIPASLGNLTTLRHLILWGNQLTGEIPTSLGNLTNLHDLLLNKNQLTGEIPASLGNLTELRYLYLNDNLLSGLIPDLSSLTSLTHLYLNKNQLSGPIPDLSSHTSLTRLYLHQNQLSGPIPDLSSLTSLTHLYLHQNQLSGPIPDLSSHTSLTRLYLHQNQLSGEIPASLDSLTSLQQLTLDQNQLSGEIPPALGDLTNLKLARFASNKDADGNPTLTGCVPHGLRYLVAAEEFAAGVPAQDFIAVDANRDGDTDDPDDIPGLNLPFCMLSALEFSDVTLTPAFASGTAAYTASVANTVAATTVTATLPVDSTDSLSIKKGTATYTSGDSVPLDVGSNEITIEVTPADARLLKQTYTVRVFREGSAESDQAALMALYNSLGGASWTTKTNWGDTGVAIGTWHGVTADGSDRVAELNLPGNNLRGTLPAALGSLTSLNALDLSENQLRGQIPDVRALTNLTTLNLGGNQVTGAIPDLSALTSLTTLNLGDNQLSGTIPDWLDSLNQLNLLYLDDNQLSGPIPAALGGLSGLDVARFAGNSLTGCVPNGLRYLVTAPVFDSLPAQDFIEVDANNNGDTADVGDTPGLGLPFCTLQSLTLDVTLALEPPFASDTVVYAASVAHAVLQTYVQATTHNFGDTVSITKGADTNTYMNNEPVPLDVGQNVITISVTTMDDTPSPHTYTVTVTRAPNTPPTFTDGPTATRGVDENTVADRNIGAPFTATDPDSSDMLIYSLDATSAASFDIDADGQLRTKAALDYETTPSYTVTVSVRDSKDSNSEADEVTDDTIRVTILVANLNEEPEFPSSETGMRSVDENTPAGEDIGAPFTATDDDEDTLTYSLDSSSDAESFSIDAASGQLQTKAALDYETGSASYTVTVTAADPSGADDTIDVTITVTNINEDGTVTLSTVQPLVSTQLVATLDDPDYVSGSVTWSWESSPDGTSSWTTINGETSDTYTPVAGDVGDYLRATASYDDEESAGKSARAVSANPVRAAPTGTNALPQFAPIDSDLYNVNENTRAGVNIGPPVAATDADNDPLTYSLDYLDRAVFDIGSTDGQLRTKAALDFETSANYFIIVTATDTAGGSDYIGITITVNNVDEPGTVTLSSLQPLVAIPLTATLDDLDVVVSGSVTWLWERSPNGTSSWNPISGATSASYTPVASDVGDYLRATASYTDGEAAGKSAQAISAHAVELAPGRNAPVFTEGASTTRSVAKSTPAGRNIGAPVAATDADNDALTYSLGGPDGNSFDVGTSSGQLRTKAPLTGIRRTSYSVFVSVSDSKDDLGEPDTAIDATTEVTILVTEVTEVNEAPVFPSAMATRTIPENTPAGVNIGAPVAATDADNDALTYSLNGADAGSFDIVSGTGQLQTKASLNRASRSSYTVIVSVSDGKDDLGEPDTAIDATTEVTILVTEVTEVNEAPVFPSAMATRTIPENTPAGVNIGAPVAATDPDNDALTYSLNGADAGSFDIDASSGQLRTKAALDFETTPYYSVTVTATDTAGATDTISVTIDVNNLDEPGTVTLDSLQPLVAFPLTATLDDPDNVSGSETWLWARSPDGTSVGTLIDGATSATYTPVADDVGDYLQATASYTDGEGSGKSAHAISANAVEVALGRNAPVFTEGASTTRSVAETTAAGVDIGAPVAATDPDNDPLTYSLGGTDAGSFDIVSGTGQLQTKASLDGASGNSYSVTVSVRDSKDDEGNPDTTTDSTIAVTILVTEVTEVNEAPVFPSAMATRTIPENTPAGVNIGAPVAATDPDNDALTYSLNGADAGSFDIDASSGQLQTKTALDYESKSSYSVTVSVRDSKDDEGNPDTTTDSTIAVTILVTEVNEAPVFPSAMATRTIPENTPAGVNIGAPVSATDADNDALTYSLNGADAGSFDIVSGTGQLQTKASLDGASGNSYSVTVSVRDSKDDEGNPDTTTDSTIAVTILVTEVNEVNEAPVFPSATATRAIPENTPAGRNIGAPVAATDPDNDPLTYSLGGTDEEFFDIDASSGQLRTKAALDYETENSYSVTMSVSDGKDADGNADEMTDNTITVTILVSNMNEALAFPSATDTRTIPENTDAGVNLGAPFTATDGDNDLLTYSLGSSGNADSFSIDAVSGQLQTKAPLDYETTPSYTVTVTAEDPSGEADTITVTITVTNVEEAGTVTLSPTQPIVDTALTVDTTLTATLDDPDVVVSGSATWLWASSPNGASSWTPISGATSDTYTPVTADVGNYLRATASYDDGQGSGKSARAVSVNPVRTRTFGNAIPQFSPSETGARSVDENTVAGVNLGAPFTATDGDNDTLTYSLDAAGAASFDIGASSGQLQTKAALDFETSANYFIIVIATDTSGGIVTIPVPITVNNVDEPGTVTLSSLQPLVAIPLTATLDDLDNVSGSGTWSWARSPDGTSSWNPISGATSDIYTPVAGDVGDYLRATASYTDGEAAGKSAQAISANAVEMAPGRNAPVFKEGANTTRSIPRNTPAGRNIGAPVSATDADNDALTYSLNGADAGSFDIVSGTGQLQTKASLDGASGNSYTVFVSVRDSKDDEGNPDTTTDSTIAVTILVTKVNKVPVFPSAMATRTIPENTPAGRNIGAPVAATDADNDALTYSLNGADAGSFDIVSGTGQLQTKASLDGASGNSYSVTVSVRDSKDDEGNPDTATDSTIAVTILVTEVTEVNEAPVFPSATATRTIPENTPAGRNIGAPVAATDADNDILTYFLDVDGAASFNIGSTDGQLQTKAPLNRASRSSYTVFVSVSDSKDDLGEPDTAIDATTAVTINITTTTTTRPSRGSSGGGRSRATPTPTPTPSPTPTATPTPTGPQFSGLIAAEPSVTATVVPEGTTLGLNGGGDLPGGVYVNFPPTAVALPVPVSVSVSNEAPSDVTAPSGTTLLPLTINITPATPLTLGEPLTIEINPTPEQLAAAGGDLNNLAVGVVTPHGVVVLPATVMHGRLVVTTDRIAPFVLLAVTDSGPTLTQPPMGDASSMGPLLQWTQPLSTTWFQVQVIPFNEDGPGINLVIGDGALVQAAQYQVLGPNFGSADPNYVMLPGMTYLWRVRTSTVLSNPTAADWSAWAVSSFKTPPASSSTITRVAPPFFGEVRTLTPTLTWANSNTAVFYYEVQVSRDFEFGPNAFLYSEYVHGGASTPANSYVVPEAFPLEAGEIYYWRVRPRIQGDGDPLPWSAINVFLTPG